MLPALLWRALRDIGPGKATLTVAFLVAAAFAVSDELHQSFVATRTASGHDVMIDWCGVLVALLLCAMLARPRASQTVS